MGVSLDFFRGLVWPFAGLVEGAAGLMREAVSSVQRSLSLTAPKVLPVPMPGGFTSIPDAIMVRRPRNCQNS